VEVIMNCIKRIILAAVIALVLGVLPTVARADVLFSPDGMGASDAVLVSLFDPGPGNALAVNSVPGVTTVAGVDFQLLYQANMQNILASSDGSNVVLKGTQFTVVANFTEHGAADPTSAHTVDFSNPNKQGTNTFQIYYNPKVVHEERKESRSAAGQVRQDAADDHREWFANGH
jgi:hypothetical protein